MNRKSSIIAAALAGLFVTAFLAGAGTKPHKRVQFFPKKNEPADPSLRKTVEEMREAIRRKNLQALLRHVDPNIRYTFGDDRHDIKTFLREWKLESDPGKSPFWEKLRAVLDYGGRTHEKDSVIFPYYFYLIPDEFAESSCGIIAGENVNIRQAPSSKSKVIDRLTYDLVRAAPAGGDQVAEKIDGETHPWVEIITPRGEKGYVFGKFFRHQLDYRAILRKKDGAWKMIAFIAGD